VRWRQLARRRIDRRIEDTQTEASSSSSLFLLGNPTAQQRRAGDWWGNPARKWRLLLTHVSDSAASARRNSVLEISAWTLLAQLAVRLAQTALAVHSRAGLGKLR
jgi:hypothetical protein